MNIMKKKINNREFKIMQGIMNFADKIHPHTSVIADSFGIQKGMTIVDYGCGPGRYTVEFAWLTGPDGRVIAVDLIEIALQETEKLLKENNIDFVELKLAQGYDSGVDPETADIVCAVDMFHHVDSAPFLNEVFRISKPNGLLIISGGHQNRNSIKKAVFKSGLWELTEETKIFIKYKKVKQEIS
jgi:ubiquinone/menaquinone biosynthesis C-methylase UbiE